MPEYIEKEALIKTVCDQYKGAMNTFFAKPNDFISIIEDAPAADVIVLPCKVGTHLWRVTHPYRQEPKVTEFVVKNFRTVGKKHQIQIEVQALNVPGTNWMRFKDFHTTKEEAEKELSEGKPNENQIPKP